MLLKTSFKVCRYTCVVMAFLIQDDIDEPWSANHVTMISTMTQINIPFSEFHFSYSRSSGAGGQNVNKVNSKVTLYWKIFETTCCHPDVIQRFRDKYGQFILDSGEVQIVSQESRSQKMNQDHCIEKLHAMLNDVARPPKIRRATKPKRSAVLKRLNTKKKDSEKKQNRRKDY
jgi:ribosome-associated protein